MHNNLQIIYKNNKPYGIRDENGYLFFFTEVAKWSGQEERYRQEVQEQFALADYLLASLQARGLTPLAPDGAVCPAHQTYFEADGTCAIVGCEYTRPAGKANRSADMSKKAGNMNNRELAIKIIEELNNRLGTRLGGVAVMLTENILNDNAAEQSFAPDASPDTVASVCEHGHIVACPHGCR